MSNVTKLKESQIISAIDFPRFLIAFITSTVIGEWGYDCCRIYIKDSRYRTQLKRRGQEVLETLEAFKFGHKRRKEALWKALHKIKMLVRCLLCLALLCLLKSVLGGDDCYSQCSGKFTQCIRGCDGWFECQGCSESTETCRNGCDLMLIGRNAATKPSRQQHKTEDARNNFIRGLIRRRYYGTQ
ncbi:uncharacterized protein LOC116608848 [Nematostella vectensis]|uniref:uncharacterized protein LOC116608848 n=1 Tax=Nematostella vectensis TaxID=45351 RepID=UPI00138FC578|nr:uncharacterized protein LOC116608848 [Nematostella vectensis]